MIAVWLSLVVVALLTAHTAVNVRLLRRPPQQPSTVVGPVYVLLPLRDEAHRVRPCLRALLDQRGVPELRIVVLDDASTDGTADVVRDIAGRDPRVHLIQGADPPPGWLGKPHACHQLAEAAAPDAAVLVFVDADVVLAPDAVAAAVDLLGDFDLMTPYPWIQASTFGSRLVQPLLQWSWLTFLPLRAMERSRRASLAAAGGQFLVLRRDAYVRAGGHASVRHEVLEDIALARAIKRTGGRIAIVDGSGIATCRMYETWPELVQGYTKSLWSSFGSPLAAGAVATLLLAVYALPLVLAVVAAARSAWPMFGVALCAYALGMLGRVITGRATRAPVWPDAFLHPVSIVVFIWLLARSYRHRRTVQWKGRPVT